MQEIIIIDANILLTIALNQPKKDIVIAKTLDIPLIAPNVLPFETANALANAVNRKQLTLEQAEVAYDIAIKIPVILYRFDIKQAFYIATKYNTYAYDAFYLQLAIETGYPILTLDKGMISVANQLGIPLL